MFFTRRRRIIAVMTMVIILFNNFGEVAQASYEKVETQLKNVVIPSETSYKKQEFRAAWVSTVFNIDWPSKKALTINQQKQEFINILEDMKSVNMNAVIFQVRPMGDALYQSSYSSWSEYLTGTQGVSPGYDPLKFAVDEAHNRNMELHSWFNPFRISTDSNFNLQNYLSRLPQGSELKVHPEWIVNYEGYHWINPGIPEARAYVINTILEVVKNYDIDGIHLDDYFYPYPRNGKEFPDSKEFQNFGSAFGNAGDWRRDNINKFVSELSKGIKEIKTTVKFGISPFGIWRNKSGEVPEGSMTNGLSSYETLYADSAKWVKEGWLDYVAPQIYWNFGYSPAPYEALIDWWTSLVKGKNISLYIGQAAYKVGSSDYGAAWGNPQELLNQIKYNRTFDEIDGNILFSIKDIQNNPLGLKDNLKNNINKYKSVIPPMTWIDSNKPVKPVVNITSSEGGGVRLSWYEIENKDVEYYIVYSFSSGEAVNTSDPAKIKAIVRKNSEGSYSFIDQVSESRSNTYVVTAVDKVHNESEGSSPVSLGGAVISSLSSDKPSPQQVFKTIKFEASAAAPAENFVGQAANLFRFSIYDGEAWSIVRDYSTSSTYEWMPTKSGNYKIKVDIKASDSSKDFDSSKELSYAIKGIYKIVVDPGHGGGDDGATGISNSYEKNINLIISKKLKKELQSYGIEVYMTREADTYPTLNERAVLANNLNSDLFISIHQNSCDVPEVNGIETYHYPGSVKGQQFASAVQTTLITNTKANDRKVKSADFQVLRETNMPAILVECGFISNQEEEGELVKDSYQSVIAASIAEGVLKYFNINKADLNKDSRLDIMDIAVLSKNYNTDSKSSMWNKSLDLNNDDLINLFDFVILSKQIQ